MAATDYRVTVTAMHTVRSVAVSDEGPQCVIDNSDRSLSANETDFDAAAACSSCHVCCVAGYMKQLSCRRDISFSAFMHEVVDIIPV